MRMSADEFLGWDSKAVTLLGMSGVGKTTLADVLPRSRWFHYSGDYRIGTRYLGEAIVDNIKLEAMKLDFIAELLRSDSIYICNNITLHNLTPLSTYMGKVGNPELGGLSCEEFLRRQRLHHDAEVSAMRDVAAFKAKSRDLYGYPHFLNDAGGSVCELRDEETLEMLAAETLIVYLRADQDMEAELIRRNRESPKPLYYDAEFFRRELAVYLRETQLDSVDRIEPDGFVQWIFPRLVEHRRPLYERIAARYGYVVEVRDAERVKDEDGFLDLVAGALDRGIEAVA